MQDNDSQSLESTEILPEILFTEMINFSPRRPNTLTYLDNKIIDKKLRYWSHSTRANWACYTKIIFSQLVSVLQFFFLSFAVLLKNKRITYISSPPSYKISQVFQTFYQFPRTF